MPAFEIVAAEPAESRETPATPSAEERKTRVQRFRSLTLKDHARLLLPFLVVGVLGGVVRLKYPYWWPAPELVSFVADSFIVVAVLGVFLDLFSARLLVERVSDGLAQKLIGRGLPAELQGPMRDMVGTDLVRDHYVKSYVFSVPEDGHVSVEIEVRYEVRNYSDAVRDYAPEIAAEIFFQPEFRFLEYGIAGRKIHTFSDENLSSKVETVDELNVRRVPRSALPPVSLKPVRSGEKSVCQVTWRYRVVMPEQFCDVTDFGEATLGATLQVQSIPKELEFVSGGDTSLHHEVGSQSWYFDKSFIAGQHLRACWFRKAVVRSSRHAGR
ncbi:MAG: hypothetical protein LAO56_10435 [Acidobacteriia bacterium]|nr:hypothetical protein [Terriglobia bacterium]